MNIYCGNPMCIKSWKTMSPKQTDRLLLIMKLKQSGTAPNVKKNSLEYKKASLLSSSCKL